MKNLYILFCLTWFTTLLTAQTEEVPFKYQNALKMSPFNLGNSELQMTYEHYFNNRHSSFSLSPSILLEESSSRSKNGWSVMGQYRFFLSHIRKDIQKTFLNFFNYSFYAGVYGLYHDESEDFTSGYWDDNLGTYITDKFKKSSQSGEGGALLGLQMDITSRILVDFYVGGGIRKSNSSDTYKEAVDGSNYSYDYSIFDPEYTGVKPKVGFQIGILF